MQDWNWCHRRYLWKFQLIRFNCGSEFEIKTNLMFDVSKTFFFFYFHLLHLFLYFLNLSYLWCHIELIITYPNLKLDFANFLAIFWYECSQWAILERLSKYLINIKWKRALVSRNSSNWNRVSVAKRKLTFQLSLEVGTDERV